MSWRQDLSATRDVSAALTVNRDNGSALVSGFE